MSRHFWKNFLNAYISMPCLWRVRTAEYSNRGQRNKCYEKLVEMCRKVEPNATKDFVLKKINSYRTSFRKEYKKVMELKLSGNENVYTPTLWYFNILLPTVDKRISRQTRYNVEELGSSQEEMRIVEVQSSVTDWDQESDEESEFDILTEQHLDGNIKIEFTDENSNEDLLAPAADPPPDATDKASSSSPSGVPFPPLLPAGFKRKNNNSEGVLVTSKRPCIPQYQYEEDEFDSVGKIVAAKLKALSKTFPAQRIIAEKIIAETLYHAQFNALTTKSCISNTSNIYEMDWLPK